MRKKRRKGNDKQERKGKIKHWKRKNTNDEKEED